MSSVNAAGSAFAASQPLVRRRGNCTIQSPAGILETQDDSLVSANRQRGSNHLSRLHLRETAPFYQRVSKKILHFLFRASGLEQLHQEAVEDFNRSPAPLPEVDLLSAAWEHYSDEPSHLIPLLKDPELIQAFALLQMKRQPLLGKTLLSDSFFQADHTQKVAFLLSHAGVGPGKLCQLMASHEGLSEFWQTALGKLKSAGAATYELDEVQQMSDAVFGPGKYQVEQRVGVGTIGEVYLAQSENGPVMMKLLKKSVTPDLLEAEWKLSRKIFSQALTEPKVQSFQLAKLERLYSQWMGELDFKREAKQAGKLSAQSKRFGVARAIEVGKTPGSLLSNVMVQAVAPGMPLDQLLVMLQQHRQDPAAFREAFAEQIAQHSWLEDPDTWKKDLPDLYRLAMNEQVFLSIKSGNKTISHGDPHAGNVFVHRNEQTGKLELVFIDTGLMVSRDSANAAKQLGFLMNMLFGNTAQLASAIVSHAVSLPDESEQALIESLKNSLDEQLFKARVNVTDGQYNYRLVEQLMQEKGIMVAEKDMAFFKAQVQAMLTYKEITRVTGQEHQKYLKRSLPDIFKGLAILLWQEPRLACQQLLPLFSHICDEPWAACRNCLQFFL